MRFFLSTLLLALTGNKNDSECSSGTELTNSFIPAGIQILTHYKLQLQGSSESHNVTVHNGKDTEATTSEPLVPVIVIAYQSDNTNSTSGVSKTIRKLDEVASALAYEANDKNLGNCRGFTSNVMMQLERNSKSTSREQLTFILKKAANENMKKPATKVLIKELLTELENRESEVVRVLQTVEPLSYLSDQ